MAIDYRPYEPTDLGGIVELCQGEAWLTFVSDTDRTHRVLTSSGVTAFPYERNENFIARERVFESGGVVAQTLQADDSSPSPSLTTAVAARAVRRESQ